MVYTSQKGVTKMHSPQSVLEDALKAPARSDLADHLDAIKALREKKWTWREIADFLTERGVDTDHTKLLRFIQKTEQRWSVPSCDTYFRALVKLREQGKLDTPHWAMLVHLYRAHNRMATYTELARAAERAGASVPDTRPHLYANREFGRMGKLIGDTVKMAFLPSSRRDAPFYSSSIGVGNSVTPEGCEFELVMHHELAKALDRYFSEVETNGEKGAAHG
jgi:hypothetical protein